MSKPIQIDIAMRRIMIRFRLRPYDPDTKEALDELANEAEELKLLGSYAKQINN